MKTFWLNLVLIVSFILCASCNTVITSLPSEISDPDLDEIAMIRADPHWGAVVIYNPKTCIEIGDACGFFRLHAYAHTHLNHTLLASPKNYPASQKAQADCWAAKLGKSNETYAAYNLFLDKNRKSEWEIHGDPFKRAENIRSCAIEAGRWLGKE
jgi:hypothetical protein